MKHVHRADVYPDIVREPGAKQVTHRRLIDTPDGADRFVLTEFELHPSGSTPPHFHDWEHEIYVLEGSMRLVLPSEERSQEVMAGDAVFIPRGEKHGFVTGEAQTCRFLVVAPTERPPVRNVFLSDDPYEYTRLPEYSQALNQGQNVEPSIDATRLHGLMTAYLQSKAIFVALELGIFDFLAQRPRSVAHIGEQLKLQPRPTLALLRALEGLGLIARNGDTYANGVEASHFLVSSSPFYMGDFAIHQNNHFGNFAQLGDAIRSNTSITRRVLKSGYSNQGAREGESRDGTKSFIQAMRVSSRLQAAKLAQAIDLDGVTSLVDLGCGSGDYSIALSQAHPGLKIISCDYPAVIDLVRKHVSEADLLDRITPTALDVLHDPLPKADAILLSHVLDGYGKEQVSSLLKRVYDALEPGGRLFLHAHIPSLSSGLFPYMFGLILLANTEEGEVRDTDDLRTLLREAGFRELQASKVSALSGLLSATK